MAVLSAKDWKAQERPSWVLDLGDGHEVVVRRPDLKTLLFENIIQTPLLNAVVKAVQEWSGDGVISVERMSQSEEFRRFVDVWVSAACASPIVSVAEPAEGVDAMWVEDLTIDTRMKIFNATFTFTGKKYQAATDVAQRFPGVADGAGPGPDVPPVQPEAQPDFVHA